jgi:hypothetical protein
LQKLIKSAGEFGLISIVEGAYGKEDMGRK